MHGTCRGSFLVRGPGVVRESSDRRVPRVGREGADPRASDAGGAWIGNDSVVAPGRLLTVAEQLLGEVHTLCQALHLLFKLMKPLQIWPRSASGVLQPCPLELGGELRLVGSQGDDPNADRAGTDEHREGPDSVPIHSTCLPTSHAGLLSTTPNLTPSCLWVLDARTLHARRRIRQPILNVAEPLRGLVQLFSFDPVRPCTPKATYVE